MPSSKPISSKERQDIIDFWLSNVSKMSDSEMIKHLKITKYAFHTATKYYLMSKSIKKENLPNTDFSKQISIQDVIKCVCSFYGLTQEELTTKGGKRSSVFPRRMAMYILSRAEPNYTNEVIGKGLGGFDECTVIHAKDAIANSISTSPDRKAEYDKIIKMIGDNMKTLPPYEELMATLSSDRVVVETIFSNPSSHK